MTNLRADINSRVFPALNALTMLLARGRFNYSDEKKCQVEIGEFLEGYQIHHEREFQLSRGVVDFYFPRSGLALEVKASKGWSKREVFRQCERYCADDRVSGLILATGRAQGLPSSILGKPVAVHQLGIGHL